MYFKQQTYYWQHWLTVVKTKFWHHYKWPFIIWAPICCFAAWYYYDPYDTPLIPQLLLWAIVLFDFPLNWALKSIYYEASDLARQQYWEELSPADKVRDYEKREWWLTWNERQDLKRLKQQLADELAATQQQPE